MSYKIEDAFPIVEANVKPFGARVLVQISKPKTKTKGGIILTDDVRDVVADNMQIAKVISFGPVAFKSLRDGVSWPEGEWAKAGDFVRVPKYAGDRWEVRYGTNDDEKVTFAIFKDLDLIAKVTGDPLNVKTYI